MTPTRDKASIKELDQCYWRTSVGAFQSNRPDARAWRTQYHEPHVQRAVALFVAISSFLAGR
jgi:hypothetical protein